MKATCLIILVFFSSNTFSQQPDLFSPEDYLLRQSDLLFKKQDDKKAIEFFRSMMFNPSRQTVRYKTIEDDIKAGKMPVIKATPPVAGKMPVIIETPPSAGIIPDMLPRTKILITDATRPQPLIMQFGN